MGKKERTSSKWENYRRSNLGSLAGLDSHTQKNNARSVPNHECPNSLLPPAFAPVLFRNEPRTAQPFHFGTPRAGHTKESGGKPVPPPLFRRFLPAVRGAR